MATSIFFNGRLISVPGSYSEVDASGLDSVGLGATGIVAVLGTAVGGRPVSDIVEPEDIPRFTNAQKMRDNFISGDLLEVGNMLFSPAPGDPNILAGAAEVLCLKCNPATQATASLQASAVDQVDLESLDYGAFTDQINVSVGAGTTKGKLITIVFEDITETIDDVGGDILSSLTYVPGTYGFTTAAATMASGALSVAATKTAAGGDGDVANAIGNVAAQVVSSSGSDTGFDIALFGLVSGVPTKEVLTLDGTNPVLGSTVWDAGSLLGAAIVDPTQVTVGSITVDPTGGLDVFLIAPGTGVSAGVTRCVNCYVNKTGFSIVADGATTQPVPVFGRNAAGSEIQESVTMNGTTPVASSLTNYFLIDFIVTGALEAARTATLSVTAAATTATAQTTIQKTADFFNAKQNTAGTEGFIFTISTGLTSFAMSNLDGQTSVNILSANDIDLTADLYLFVSAINTNSQLVSATQATGATVVPDNTPSPVFLAGGSEGTTTFAQYQNALNLLKKVRVNSIVDLSGDPAVAAALNAHCAYMGGIGRSERDGFVGAVKTTGGVPDVPFVPAPKTDLKAQIVDINSRHIRVAGQFIERFNAAGERTEFPSPFLGAIAAGMQAGSPVGTSLTFKYPSVLKFRQDSTWNPVDDAEEMVQAGCLFLEEVDGVGRRFVRNVTTHLSSNNLAFVEGSVNEAVNFATFNLRTGLEFAVGQQGFAGTANSVRAAAINILGLLVDAGVITGYRSLQVELVGDVMDVSVELAPTSPVNFVRTTVHLVTLQQLAAAAA